MGVAIRSSIFLLIFILLFCYLFYRFYWKDLAARKMFWVFMIIFGVVVVIKFIIGIFYKGYIPELLFFYGIPSPKILGYFWFILASLVLLLFMRYRDKIEFLSVNRFLLCLFIVFSIFTISVAAVREGLSSVAEPYTKIYWEYTGNFPYIQTVRNFLQEYIIFELQPPVALHSITHPPGYTLILYFLSKIFSVGFLGLAVLTVLIAGLVLWPLYYLWKYFLSEFEVRRSLEVLIFIPSIVMMTATSTESFLLVLVWSAVTTCFIGWQNNWSLAIFGGCLLAAALFCNFLFLLLVPFFIFLGWLSFSNSTISERIKILFRILLSLLTFSLFFIFIYKWSGYSIIDNFFTARVGNQKAVDSNFGSVAIYFLYFFINLISFLVYLGLPLVYLFFSDWRKSFKNSSILFKSGVFILGLFLIVGVFQGNTERLWLFVLPFFPIFANKLFKEEYQSLFNPFLAITFFQIMLTQIIFYTFY